MPELLLELFSEEIPARMQAKAADDLMRLLCDGLKGAGLPFGNARAFSTPRRLAVVVEDVPATQPDTREERKGPKVGAPDKAVEGFLRSAGLETLDQCEQREMPKGPVWVAVIEKKGRDSADVLPEIVTDAIRNVPWAKSMRFRDQGFRWVRPLHRILAVFDGAALEGTFDLRGGEIRFTDEVVGHRFLGGEPVRVSDFESYGTALRDNYVILDPAERRALIAEQLAEQAEAADLKVRDDAGLLQEVAGLVEYPNVLIGRIDDEFMEVPPEVLTSSMRAHQKYFALDKPDGTMAPNFAVVANMKAADGGKAIVAGNERVLRARLADAKFFWDQDRQTRLDDFLPRLEKVTFHAKLGTLAERVDRMAALSGSLADVIDGADRQKAIRAANLAKTDLVSEMVGEFPELQGIMGRYYALHQGEDAVVAEAIADHYSPAGPTDLCPEEPTAVAVAIAEKLDTLVGFWLIDEKPTGSKDPYALRRAALGIIRLILENGLRLSLKSIIGEAASLYVQGGHAKARGGAQDTIETDLLRFFADRLRVHLKDEGVRHDMIQALFALGDEDDLVRLVARVHALRDFLASDDGANLLVAYRRAANILKAEEKKDDTVYSGAPDASKFTLSAETALADALTQASGAAVDAAGDEDYARAMGALSRLRAPVDAFFDEVTVNAEEADLRRNRLLLLSGIRETMGKLADFGLIEG